MEEGRVEMEEEEEKKKGRLRSDFFTGLFQQEP